LMLSRMVARRRDDEYSSKFHITERETVYESPILLTPYEGEHRIDAEAIDAHIRAWYDEAGVAADDIDTGAVIITGEANRKENADRIIELFSESSGRFVCATAGANLESLMAAHGSGAVELGLETGRDVLHVDIGGGTTKLAYIVDGIVTETVAINVGARLVAFDDGGRVDRLEDAARRVADDIGVDLALGEPLDEADRERLADRFAAALFELVDGSLTDLGTSLLVTEPPASPPEYDVVTFSGGGAEYIYDHDPGFYDDLGPELGAAIRRLVAERDLAVEELTTGIRATALGSNQHTVQVSGNTITITDESLLPMRNVPMVPFVVDHEADPDELVEHIRDRLEMYDVDELAGGFAFGFHLHGRPSYDFLRKVVDGAIAGRAAVDGTGPLAIAFDADVALNAGAIAAERVDAPVIAVDGVELDQFGYLDIGEPLEDTNAVPLTVKSLVFEG
ncbi:MAG: ethanolamine ammonia-lyase reactivating factor EutA, partial [Halobacteriales archaeon]|nr:ethanolamine ammonia-lyase reactivating factor EutA [Halobacteriales archaeon]